MFACSSRKYLLGFSTHKRIFHRVRSTRKQETPIEFTGGGGEYFFRIIKTTGNANLNVTSRFELCLIKLYNSFFLFAIQLNLEQK